MTVTVGATAAAAGTQSSTASVSSGATDLVAANNSATASTKVTAVVGPPLQVPSKSGGGALSMNELLTLALILIMRVRALGSVRPRARR